MGRKPSVVRTCPLGCTWTPISMYIKVEGNDAIGFCLWRRNASGYIRSMFTQGRGGEGKQRMKVRFYKSLKSTRPLAGLGSVPLYEGKDYCGINSSLETVENLLDFVKLLRHVARK